MEKYFLVQVKRTNGTIEKGVVVKDTYDGAQQSFHAYLGAYAYGNHQGTDFVLVHILNSHGLGMKGEVWEQQPDIPAEVE